MNTTETSPRVRFAKAMGYQTHTIQDGDAGTSQSIAPLTTGTNMNSLEAAKALMEELPLPSFCDKSTKSKWLRVIQNHLETFGTAAMAGQDKLNSDWINYFDPPRKDT